MAAQQQIIALGGGGFLMEPENPLLDRYIWDTPQYFARLFVQIGAQERARKVLSESKIKLGNRGDFINAYLVLGEFDKTFEIIRTGI